MGHVRELQSTAERCAPSFDMDNPAAYLKFFRPPQEVAMSPRAERYVHAEAMGIETRQDSWKWMGTQVWGYL